MKCHYEVLGVDCSCSNDDLKKAYRKLALEWHPDKNLERQAEAKENFQLIQQAYELLVDPQERAWYDRHRDDILRGDAEESYKNDCLNVYQYFNTSCFKGYNDGEKGFYTVYRGVFEKIAAEDKPFMDEDEDFDFPTFGSSDSSYEDVVYNFYAYWQSYCTEKSYSWEDQYDLSDARKSGAGRHIIRQMEKENKKLRDTHRKARNEEVRELVAFVRKRDKRVQAHKILSEERKIEKAKQAEEQRRQQILERNRSLENYKESEWASSAKLEEKFNELENTLDNTFGIEAASVEENGELYCPACEKDFRSEKAFKNHENSKKHKENLILLRYLMEQEEMENKIDDDEIDSDDIENDHHVEHNTDDSDNEIIENHDENDMLEEKISDSECTDTSKALLDELIKNSTKSKKKKKKNKNNLENNEEKLNNTQITEIDSMLQDTKIKDTPAENLNSVVDTTNTDKCTSESYSKKKKTKKSTPSIKKEPLINSEDVTEETEKASTLCETCNVDFKSRNKLFSHLKESGHAVYKNGDSKHSASSGHSKKQKKKKS